MKKRLLSLMLVVLILLSSTLSVLANPMETIGESIVNVTKEFMETLINEAVAKFKDLKATDWFAEAMTRLSVLGGISGYPDGTLKPNGTITKGEFTKMLVGTLGYDVKPAKSGVHWARPWVDKAYALKYISDYDIEWVYSDKQLNEPITRELMADMIMRSTNETVANNDYEIYQLNMSDYYKISSTYSKSVLKAYGLGIIAGYPDGTFGPKRNATRAEASTMIMKLIDPNTRTPQEPKGKETLSNDPDVAYINSLVKKYPNNSIVKDKWNWRYSSTQKPTTGVMDSGLIVSKVPPVTTKERDYQIVLFDNHTEKDKEVLKEVLKELYPMSYEKVYKQIIARFKDSPTSNDIVDRIDNRNVLYRRSNSSIDAIVGIKGNKAVWGE